MSAELPPSERGKPGAPTWRAPTRAAAPYDRVFVACCCGADMLFEWPAGRDDVRCFACGAAFARPQHLPAPPPVAAPPPPLPALVAARRRALVVGLLVGLCAGVLAAAVALLLLRP